MNSRLPLFMSLLALSLSPAYSSTQSKAPAIRQKPAEVRVDLPSGWESKPPPMKKVVQFAAYRDHSIYFELVLEPKMDFSESMDLMAWAKLVKENSAKESTLERRKDTELRRRTVAGRETIEYEVTGESRGVKLHFRNILLQSGDQFCKLVCWSVPSQWDEAQEKFDELVSHLH